MSRQIPEGTKVKFRHERRTDTYALLLAKGGSTTCRLVFPDGNEIVATAECSRKDNYCKRIGRDIALGRALKDAASKYPELFKKEVTA